MNEQNVMTIESECEVSESAVKCVYDLECYRLYASEQVELGNDIETFSEFRELPLTSI